MVFASVKRESQVYVSFNHKSTCLLTNCCCRHQVRSCFSSSLKNTQCLPCSRMFIFFVSPFCPAGMGTISVPLENTSDTHSSYKGCQNKVCGDRCADLYRKVLSVKLTRFICTTSPHSLPLSLKHPPTHAASLQHCEIASC